MTRTPIALALMAANLLTLAPSAQAGSLNSAEFVNGLALSGGALDNSSGTAVERRVGYFSDIYYDAIRNEWWGLSDRGPGGGLLRYETRVQRFKVDVAANGAISHFSITDTIKFSDGGQALNGLAPSPSNALGKAFDPEGFVVNPKTGTFLVSDEYGPSLLEFNRSGQLIRRFETPANLVPRNAASGEPNFAGDTGNTAGKRTNRGFEGLAISADGKHAYAMLQSAMLDEGGGDGRYARIVKYDVATGQAVAQYAYLMDTASQGRGISSLVALGDDRFLVLERNNRGVGVGATLAPADKAVYEISLAGAVDVTGISLPARGAGFVGAVTKSSKKLDLDANTLGALGNQSPEKWEGLAVGPRLANGDYLLLAGTDNDYSVTQSGTGTQFDVWFNFAAADPYASSIQCPIGETMGCFFTATNATALWDDSYALLPGVLHAYSANLTDFVRAVPEPKTLVLTGVAVIGALVARRRLMRMG